MKMKLSLSTALLLTLVTTASTVAPIASCDSDVREMYAQIHQSVSIPPLWGALFPCSRPK